MNRRQRRNNYAPTRRNALRFQAMGLALLGSAGEKVNSLIGDHWHWRDDDLTVLCMSAGGKLPPATDPASASFLRRKLVLPHCIAVTWKAKAVFRVRWADDGRVVICLFVPGPWIDALLKAAASLPAMRRQREAPTMENRQPSANKAMSTDPAASLVGGLKYSVR